MKFTITIQDQKNDTTEVVFVSDPPLDLDNDEEHCTKAALLFLKVVSMLRSQENGKIISEEYVTRDKE